MRIIAGKFKSRQLKTLKHKGTRPTPDKVREALFSITQADVKDGVVLDLFSGTGAIGLEALSRGAKSAYLADKNKESYNLIVENDKMLDAGAKIYNMDFKLALDMFKNDNLKFDVIFLDPPYASEFGLEAMNIISEEKLLKENGALIYEHDKEKLGFEVPKNLRIYDKKRYGSVYLTFLTLND